MADNFFKIHKGLSLAPISADPSNPSEGDLQFSDGTVRPVGLWQYKSSSWSQVGSGAGAGGINYIDNPSAEADTTGYATYADAAGSNPVDGTGGTANITFTRNTTTPLRDTGDFKLAKDAVNRQGEGVSYDFSIDNADKAKVLTIKFDADTSDANYADGDIRVMIYDITNGVLIEPSSRDLLAGKGTFQAQFQTASDSTSYRLIFHVSSTNATAYNVYLDNIQVGPSQLAYANPVTDWIEYTLTITGSTSDPTEGTGLTKKAYWRRVGDNMEIRFEYIHTGAGSAGSGTYQFELPSGYTIDSNKVTYPSTGNRQNLGSATCYDGTTNYASCMFATTSTALAMFRQSTGQVVSSSINALSNASVRFGFIASVPIQGWGNVIQVSDHNEGRLVALRYTGSSSSMTGTPSKVTFTTADFDTHSIYSAGTVTIPHSGKYKIMGSFSTADVAWSAGHNYNIYIYKNGSSQSLRVGVVEVARTDGFMIEINEVLDLVKGDTIEIYGATSVSVTLNGGYLTLESLSSSSAISASETIAVNCTNTSGQSLTNTYSKITGWTVGDDSHGWFSSDQFNVGASGWYEFVARLSMVAASYAISDIIGIKIQKNGTDIAEEFIDVSSTSSLGYSKEVKTPPIKCVAGDVITILGRSETTNNMNTNSWQNYFGGKRIGL